MTADVVVVKQSGRHVFRQLFDAESSTYTYLLADPRTGEALLIDPVLEQVERDLCVIDQLGLQLKYVVNTHCHADHITGSGKIKALRPGVRSVISSASGARADVHISAGQVVHAGAVRLRVLSTPGHTNGCVSYYLTPSGGASGAVFTGDALLVRGCGRTDFQEGSAERLYESVHTQLFTLPDDTVVYPAHDYKGHTSSTIGEEKRHNPRLTQPQGRFVEIMDGLGLARPKKIDVAVPANLKCGEQD